MAHVAKFSQSALGHMNNHYERISDDCVRRGNTNIDSTRTHMNYNLAADMQPKSGTEFIAERLGNVRVQNRADVIKMADWVVTQPKTLPPERSKEFFQHTFQFLSDRYGRNNVVSAHVHMDETTPHLHFAFVPVTKNTGKSAGKYPEKLCARQVLTRHDLQTFHTDLQRYLQEKMQCRVDVLNENTAADKPEYVEMTQFKRQKAIETANQLDVVAQQLDRVAESDAEQLKNEPQLKTHRAYRAEERGVLFFKHKEAVPVPGYVTVAQKDLHGLQERAGAIKATKARESIKDEIQHVRTALTADYQHIAGNSVRLQGQLELQKQQINVLAQSEQAAIRQLETFAILHPKEATAMKRLQKAGKEVNPDNVRAWAANIYDHQPDRISRRLHWRTMTPKQAAAQLKIAKEYAFHFRMSLLDGDIRPFAGKTVAESAQFVQQIEAALEKRAAGLVALAAKTPKMPVVMPLVGRIGGKIAGIIVKQPIALTYKFLAAIAAGLGDWRQPPEDRDAFAISCLKSLGIVNDKTQPQPSQGKPRPFKQRSSQHVNADERVQEHDKTLGSRKP